jgi:5-methyltetrahydrofolate--homocysteine methyltransferase
MSATFYDLLQTKKPILLDGATGTQLHLAGLPAGLCPESWLLQNPALLQRLQRDYLAAGSTILYTFTLGANRIKLAGHHLDISATQSINRQLAAISTAVRDQWRSSPIDAPVLVAGDLAPTGQFLKPAGNLSFLDLIDLYREQVRGQLEAGVDLFVVETMVDLAQARAAVLAVQAECDLPIMVSITVEANGRTLAGNTPLACLISLASLGVAAFGLNCSFGPDQLAELILPLLAVSPIPLLVKPNAGLPSLVDGQTIFPMQPDDFAQAMLPLAEAGIQLLGGCCGTSPDHIASLAASLKTAAKPNPVCRPADCGRWISSSRTACQVYDLHDLPQVPCSSPDCLDDCLDAAERTDTALILDLVSWPITQLTDLTDYLQDLQAQMTLPLIFKCHDPITRDTALRAYHGRAGVITSDGITLPGAMLFSV